MGTPKTWEVIKTLIKVSDIGACETQVAHPRF